MADTIFKLDPEIIIGMDTVNRAGALFGNRGKKILIATEQRLYENNHIERLVKILENAGLDIILFDEIPAQGTADIAENAASLARQARERGLNVWCFTGKTWEELTKPGAPREWGALLEQINVLVDGPFVEAKRTLALPWRGSANQRIIDVQASLEGGICTPA